MTTAPTHTTVNTNALIKRYKDAYRVATVVISFGTALKVLGFILGIGSFLAAGLTSQHTPNMPPAMQAVCFLVGVPGGILMFAVFYILGVLSSCQGQVLRAGLDEAVYVCPFLTDSDRITAASLSTN